MHTKSRFTQQYAYAYFNYFCIDSWYKIVWRKALQSDTVSYGMMS